MWFPRLNKMQRILILGSGGAGKSTLARQLGKQLDIQVIHLDRMYWKSGWVESDHAIFDQALQQAMTMDQWVMDGNYSRTIDQRLAAADTVIFLDLSRLVCIGRIFKRRWRYHGRSRPDIAEGCPERLDFEFLRWIWHYPRDNKPRLLNKLKVYEHEKRVIVLRSRRAVQCFIDELRRA